MARIARAVAALLLVIGGLSIAGCIHTLTPTETTHLRRGDLRTNIRKTRAMAERLCQLSVVDNIQRTTDYFLGKFRENFFESAMQLGDRLESFAGFLLEAAR